MLIAVFFFSLFIISPLILFWRLYNRLVKGRNMVEEAWSGIDVQLKRRYNLIPSLVVIVQGYAKHEKKVFEEVVSARQAGIDAEERGSQEKAENALTGTLKSLFAVVENYPDLKASRNFLKLQNELIEIEDQIQYARRYYNGSVRNYNITVESFPSNLVAGFLKFQSKDFFEISLTTERAVPSVNLNEGGNRA